MWKNKDKIIKEGLYSGSLDFDNNSVSDDDPERQASKCETFISAPHLKEDGEVEGIRNLMSKMSHNVEGQALLNDDQ